MTKLERLRKNVRTAKTELEEVMQGAYDDIICRSFAMMLNDAENELHIYLEREACRV